MRPRSANSSVWTPGSAFPAIFAFVSIILGSVNLGNIHRKNCDSLGVLCSSLSIKLLSEQTGSRHASYSMTYAVFAKPALTRLRDFSRSDMPFCVLPRAGGGEGGMAGLACLCTAGPGMGRASGGTDALE